LCNLGCRPVTLKFPEKPTEQPGGSTSLWDKSFIKLSPAAVLI